MRTVLLVLAALALWEAAQVPAFALLEQVRPDSWSIAPSPGNFLVSSVLLGTTAVVALVLSVGAALFVAALLRRGGRR